MNRLTIDLPRRDWQKYRIQGIEGNIVKINNTFKIEVEVMELPMHYAHFNYVFPYELNDDLIDCTVIGDIGPQGYVIRILCLDQQAKLIDD